MIQTLLLTKAVSESKRVRVLMALKHHNELCACHIASMLKLTAPTVSRHMSILQAAGLVAARKDSRWVYYRLSDDTGKLPMKPLVEWLVSNVENNPIIDQDRKFLEQRPVCETEKGCKQR